MADSRPDHGSMSNPSSPTFYSNLVKADGLDRPSRRGKGFPLAVTVSFFAAMMMDASDDSDFMPDAPSGGPSSGSYSNSSKKSKKKSQKKSSSKAAGKENKSRKRNTPSRPPTKGPKSKKPKKPPTLSHDDALAAVQAYMEKQNRPYSHTQIFENLHRRIKKTHVPGILHELANRGVLTMQAFGKTTKIYYANQAKFPEVDKQQLAKLDAKIESLKAELKSVTAAETSVDRAVRKLEASPTDDLLASQLKSLSTEHGEKQARLETLKETGTAFSDEQLQAIDDQLRGMLKSWKKHKKAVGYMVDMMLEGIHIKKKALETKLGLEYNAADEEKLKTLGDLVS